MDIKSMTLDELKDACQQMGEKPFRAKQLYDWMHHRLAGSYDEMTNLSLAFREKLKEQYPLTCLEKVQVQESKIDGSRKYLFRLHLIPGRLPDGLPLLRVHNRRTRAVPDSVGDARPDLPDSGGHRGAGLQSGCHGNG